MLASVTLACVLLVIIVAALGKTLMVRFILRPTSIKRGSGIFISALRNCMQFTALVRAPENFTPENGNRGFLNGICIDKRACVCCFL